LDRDEKIDEFGESSAEHKGASAQVHECARTKQKPKQNTLDMAGVVRDVEMQGFGLVQCWAGSGSL
jgi:hypothetical protein